MLEGSRLRYPVISVTMDMMLIGLGREIVEPGRKVEIIGPNISVVEWADVLGVSLYEVVTGLGKRVKRVYE
jgi:alanine racemase